MGAAESVSGKARKLAGELSRMSDDKRAELAQSFGAVVNPSGHVLTVNNAALLMLQSGRVDLTMVAGFKQWIGAGRCVKKGERSIGCIAVPMMLKPKTNGNGETEKQGRIRFRYVAVFDVSQTDKIEQ